MSADVVVHSVLVADPGVIGELSSRVYVDMIPENAAIPCAVITLIDGIPFQGVWHQAEWWRSRVQVDVYGKTKSSTIEAVEAVKAALKRYRGTVGSVVVDDIMLIAERSEFSVDAEMRLASLDFTVIHKE